MKADKLREWVSKPTIDWQRLDPRVKLLFVPDSGARHIPDADAVFATTWYTVRSVLDFPAAKGEKFYLIQAYETWMGPKEMVDATWRSPLHKIVISKWLLELGKELGCKDPPTFPMPLTAKRTGSETQSNIGRDRSLCSSTRRRLRGRRMD